MNRMRNSVIDQMKIESFGFVLAVMVCVLICVCLAAGDFAGSPDVCRIQIDGRINPNTAPRGSLVRLPRIGIGLAGSIISYREDFAEEHGQKQAFGNYRDMRKVKGIGAKTVENIKDLVKFE